ncbi:MAG TPA: hypothetical protein VF587_01445 [Solirubrobacteraceae bacterium]|jgi:uncharacterized membrane protein YeaQ/YmgE (transglycosylase-associated protein family)
MSLLAFIISLAFMGLIVGALARLALPGRDPMSIGQTILVGMAGTLAAGLIAAYAFGRNGGSFLLAVLFSTLIVYFVRRSRGGTVSRPAPRRRGAFGRPF